MHLQQQQQVLGTQHHVMLGCHKLPQPWHLVTEAAAVKVKIGKSCSQRHWQGLCKTLRYHRLLLLLMLMLVLVLDLQIMVMMTGGILSAEMASTCSNFYKQLTRDHILTLTGSTSCCLQLHVLEFLNPGSPMVT